jgi:hypothetical protein
MSDGNRDAPSPYLQDLYRDLYQHEESRADRQFSRQSFTLGNSTILLAGIGYIWRELSSSQVATGWGYIALWSCLLSSFVAAGFVIAGIVRVIIGMWPRPLSPIMSAQDIFNHAATYRSDYLERISESAERTESLLDSEIKSWVTDQCRLAATDLAARNNDRSFNFSWATIWLANAALVLLFSFGCLHALYALRKPPSSITVNLPSSIQPTVQSGPGNERKK